MVSRTRTVTTREYDKDGKLTKEIVEEFSEDSYPDYTGTPTIGNGNWWEKTGDNWWQQPSITWNETITHSC